LAALEEAELVLKDSQLEPSGNLRIDMPVSFGRLKVVPLLGPFQAKYPHIKLRVTFTDRYIDLIEEGVDVCMRLGPLYDSSLIARRLSGTGFKVAGSPRYFAKFGKPKRIEDLTDHNCLAFTFRETRLARPWRFMQEGVEKSLTPKGNMSFSDGAAVCDAACAGYGLAQLQDYFTDPAIAQGKLVSVLDRFKPMIEPVWLVYPQTRHLTPTVRVFVDFMAAQFRSRPRERTAAP
jgi:DNA-binding transcriptional LysR family regulator